MTILYTKNKAALYFLTFSSTRRRFKEKKNKYIIYFICKFENWDSICSAVFFAFFDRT